SATPRGPGMPGESTAAGLRIGPGRLWNLVLLLVYVVTLLLQHATALHLAPEHVLVQHHELHAAVLRQVERACVRGDRLRFAVAADRVLARLQGGELLRQVSQHRAGAGLAQRLVPRLGAARIGVATNLDLEIRPLD